MTFYITVSQRRKRKRTIPYFTANPIFMVVLFVRPFHLSTPRHTRTDATQRIGERRLPYQFSTIRLLPDTWNRVLHDSSPRLQWAAVGSNHSTFDPSLA